MAIRASGGESSYYLSHTFSRVSLSYGLNGDGELWDL